MQKPVKRKPANKMPQINRSNQNADLDAYLPYSIKYAHVKSLLDQGKTFRQIEAITGVSHGSIANIKQGRVEVNSSLVDQIKKHESSKLLVLSNRILDSISKEDVDKASLLQRATAYGIFTEKRRLIAGESTNNVSFQGIVNDLSTELDRIKQTRSELEND